jgi:hypothetical protein
MPTEDADGVIHVQLAKPENVGITNTAYTLEEYAAFCGDIPLDVAKDRIDEMCEKGYTLEDPEHPGIYVTTLYGLWVTEYMRGGRR